MNNPPSARHATPPQSLDVFALTNPAFGSLVIFSFVEAYSRGVGMGAELALAFLPLPIAASSSLAGTFSGMSAKSNLLAWATRNPQVILELPDYVREAVPLSRRALLFGLQRRILLLNDERIVSNPVMLDRHPKDPSGLPIARKPLAIASRFGHLCGAMGPASAIYTTLGIRP